jgi:predicted NUDIX family phosphoesterase
MLLRDTKSAGSLSGEEQILVIERRVLEQIGMFYGLAFDVVRYLRRIFAQGIPRFMPRSQAEEDPSYKQLIPYVIMNYEGKYLSYVRGKRAGERRLAGNRSIGIGGHINPIDDMPLFNASVYEIYLAAVEREVAEEVSLKTSHTNHIVALLNDESNEVGRVHLGIVHYWVLDAPKVNKKEQMITQMSFMSPAELEEVKDTLETWSGLCLSRLTEMSNRRESELQVDLLFKDK